jgi:hypothetical protein
MSVSSPTAAAEDAHARSRRTTPARQPLLDGRNEVCEDAAAAAARGASYYRRLRRERRQPAAGELLAASSPKIGVGFNNACMGVEEYLTTCFCGGGTTTSDAPGLWRLF